MPTVLSTFPDGSHYFQLAEIKLATTSPSFVPPVPTQIEPMYGGASNDILWSAGLATDGNVNTAYSSGFFSTALNNRGTFLAAWLPGGMTSVSKLNLTARTSAGEVMGFPDDYDVYVTSADDSQWFFVGHFSTQPNASGIATVELGGIYQTFGVMIVPSTLGVDDNGNHYFQMAEVNLSN